MNFNNRPTILTKPDQTGVILYHINKIYESKLANGSYVFEEIIKMETSRPHAFAMYVPGYLVDDC